MTPQYRRHTAALMSAAGDAVGAAVSGVTNVTP